MHRGHAFQPGPGVTTGTASPDRQDVARLMGFCAWAIDLAVQNQQAYVGLTPAHIAVSEVGGVAEGRVESLNFRACMFTNLGRDHLDSGSVAMPHRETENMKDGSDAIADWPLLNALLNCSSGADLVAIHGLGSRGVSAGVTIVADGAPATAERLKRVLDGDPGIGILRQADAGYDIAIEQAERVVGA